MGRWSLGLWGGGGWRECMWGVGALEGNRTRACLTFSCSTCSGFSSFCTEWGGTEELMMIEICTGDTEGRVNSGEA